MTASGSRAHELVDAEDRKAIRSHGQISDLGLRCWLSWVVYAFKPCPRLSLEALK